MLSVFLVDRSAFVTYHGSGTSESSSNWTHPAMLAVDRDSDVGRGDETGTDGVRWRGYKMARHRNEDDGSSTGG